MTRKCTLVLHIAARGLCDVKGKRCTSVLYNQCKCTFAQSNQCTVSLTQCNAIEVSCKQRKALHKGEPGTLSSIHPGFVIIIIFLIASIIINPKESLPFLQ